jgi:tetratricopeptide (TPR) repeat protein
VRDAKTAKPARTKVPLTAKQKRQRLMMAGGAVVVLALAAGGYMWKQKQDEKKARAAAIKTGLNKALAFMKSDDDGHWDQATAEADKLLRLDAKNGEAIGLAAQARLAGYEDEGTQRQRVDMAAQMVVRAGASPAGPELEKARALKMLVADDKPADAAKALTTITQRTRDADAYLYLGWADLEANDATNAVTAFTAALQAVPDRVPALYGLARAQLALGQKDKATATFAQLAKKRDTHLGMRVALAEMLPEDRKGTREQRFLEILGSKEAKAPNADPRVLAHAYTLAGDEQLAGARYADAFLTFKKAIDANKDDLDAQAGLGFAELGQGQLDDARVQFGGVNAVIAASPAQHLTAMIGLVRVALAKGDFAEARKNIDMAVDQNSENPDVQYWLGEVAEKEPPPDGPKNAEAAYRKAIDLAKDRIEPRVALASMLLDRTKKPELSDDDKKKLSDEATEILKPVEEIASKDVYLSNQLGIAYLAGHHIDDAKHWFNAALAIDPKNVDARANLGSALEASDPPDLPGAIEAYKAAYETDGGAREDIALRLAMAYEKTKDFGDAESVYAKLVAGKPTIGGRSAAGRFYARRGNLSQVATIGDSISKEDPNNAAGQFLQGVTALAKKDGPTAQKFLETASRTDPQAQYFEALGRALELQQKWDDALAAHTRATELDKDFAAPLVGRARIRIQRRQFPLAEDDLKEAARLEPDQPETYMLTGQALYGDGAFKDATKPLDKAIQLDPKMASAYYWRGKSYRERGDRTDAVVGDLRKAVDLAKEQKLDDTWIIDAWYVLGDTYRMSGRKSEMCAAYREYEKIAPATATERKEVDGNLIQCGGE